MDNQNQRLASSTPALPGVGGLLKRTWRAYKARLGTFLGIMVVPVLVYVALEYSKPIVVFIASVFPPPIFFIFRVALVVTVIVIGLWAQVSLLFAIQGREQKTGVIESFRKGWHKILSFVWVSILAGFLILGGFGLFIIPGIIFSIWFIFSTYVLVAEDKNGMQAIFRSKQWVGGYWWKILWRLLIIGILIITISFAINIPFSFFLRQYVSQFVEQVIGWVISIFLTPLFITYTFLIYEDLRRVKGEISFESPKRRTKVKYVLVGALGNLLVLTLFSLPILKLLI